MNLRRKLRPSQLEFTNINQDDESNHEEETVSGTAQELLTWARAQTQHSTLVNVTNLTSSFRSG